MKKLMMTVVALVMAISANAQYLNDSEKVFYEGKWYIGASASGLDLSWHEAYDWKLNLDVKGGYLFTDDWMITAKVGLQAQTDCSSAYLLGAGIRYYFESCGIYLGASGNYLHSADYNDFRPELNVGYSYFLSRHITLEPEVYYEYSTDSHERSGFGVRVGFGLYI